MITIRFIPLSPSLPVPPHTGDPTTRGDDREETSWSSSTLVISGFLIVVRLIRRAHERTRAHSRTRALARGRTDGLGHVRAILHLPATVHAIPSRPPIRPRTGYGLIFRAGSKEKEKMPSVILDPGADRGEGRSERGPLVGVIPRAPQAAEAARSSQ
jgi:hypothetical protein